MGHIVLDDLDNLSDVGVMSYTPEQWQSIETQARKLGASEEQIRKWRERGGVAATWHAKLAMADKSLLKVFAKQVAA